MAVEEERNGKPLCHFCATPPVSERPLSSARTAARQRLARAREDVQKRLTRGTRLQYVSRSSPIAARQDTETPHSRVSFASTVLLNPIGSLRLSHAQKPDRHRARGTALRILFRDFLVWRFFCQGVRRA